MFCPKFSRSSPLRWLILTMMMIMFGVVKEAREQGLELQQVSEDHSVYPARRPAVHCAGHDLVRGQQRLRPHVGLERSRGHESLGISPWSILWPVFLCAIVLSLVTVYLNDLAVSWGRSNVKRIVIESVEEIAYSMLRTQRAFSAPQISRSSSKASTARP